MKKQLLTQKQLRKSINKVHSVFSNNEDYKDDDEIVIIDEMVADNNVIDSTFDNNAEASRLDCERNSRESLPPEVSRAGQLNSKDFVQKARPKSVLKTRHEIAA